MSVTGFDHVAIPTARPEEMLRFYRTLGFGVLTPEEWSARGEPFFTIQFGYNKINVHAPALWQNPAFTLRGPTAQPGCGDFCFVWSGTLDELRAMLQAAGAPSRKVRSSASAGATPAAPKAPASTPAIRTAISWSSSYIERASVARIRQCSRLCRSIARALQHREEG